MSDEQKELEQIKSEMNKIRKTVEEIKKDNKFFKDFIEILYLICDYPHKHYTFKHFEV